MLYAFALLCALQLLGELLVRWSGLPLPGPLVGALLLLAGLLIVRRLPAVLESTALGLLQHMMLLFIPTIAGVMLHWERIAREWQPFVIAGIGGTALTLLATAATFRWMLVRQPAPPAAPTQGGQP